MFQNGHSDFITGYSELEKNDLNEKFQLEKEANAHLQKLLDKVKMELQDSLDKNNQLNVHLNNI